MFISLGGLEMAVEIDVVAGPPAEVAMGSWVHGFMGSWTHGLKALEGPKRFGTTGDDKTTTGGDRRRPRGPFPSPTSRAQGPGW